jgi:hypothetical protein
MSRKEAELDFNIYVDPSCLSTPMDEEALDIDHERMPDQGDDLSQIPNETVDHEEVNMDESPDVTQVDFAKHHAEEEDIENHEEREAADENAGRLSIEMAHDNRPASPTQDTTAMVESTSIEAQMGDDMDEDVAESLQSSPSAELSPRDRLSIEAAAAADAEKIIAEIGEKARAKFTDDRSKHARESSLSWITQESSHADESEVDAEDTVDMHRRQASNSSIESHDKHTSRSVSGDEGLESGSQNDADSDMFSHHSLRSSLASVEDFPDQTPKSPIAESRNVVVRSKKHPAPRVSGISSISAISQYEDQEFIPENRPTPRTPFRTPSAVRAFQMTSPTPSVFSGFTPKSRMTGPATDSKIPIVSSSRAGSRPGTSGSAGPKSLAQRSRANTTTGSRPPSRGTKAKKSHTRHNSMRSVRSRHAPEPFDVPEEGHLVLLQVSLEPLQWTWGDVLNGLENYNRRCAAFGKDLFEPSDELKALRDVWSQLQDRVGDLVISRGILIDHPQNDFELLEERLLEALELPLRRRARILECGHYLGPTNEMADDEDTGSEDEYTLPPSLRVAKRHWCNTCRGEIKYEDLGPGKVFRVKVYASSGLMGPGAWTSCWEQMENVDVEVIPIVEPGLLRELQRLASLLKAETEGHSHMDEPSSITNNLPSSNRGDVFTAANDRMQSAGTSPMPPSSMRAMHASPPAPPTSSPLRSQFQPTSPLSAIDMSEDRLRREAVRLREIYGHTPSPSAVRRSVSFTPPEQVDDTVQPDESPAYDPLDRPTPRSPSEEAAERRAARQRRNNAYQTASLLELLFEAFKVLMRDKKNVAIVLLSMFVMMLAVRRDPPGTPDSANAALYRYNAEPVQVESVLPSEDSQVPKMEPVIDQGAESVAATVSVAQTTASDGADVAKAGPDLQEDEAETVNTKIEEVEEVVRIRKTVTETVRVTATEAV